MSGDDTPFDPSDFKEWLPIVTPVCTEDVETIEDSEGSPMSIVKHEGVCFPPLRNIKENLSTMKEMKPMDGDVWVLTYPKSGTHFAMSLMQGLEAPDGKEDDYVIKQHPPAEAIPPSLLKRYVKPRRIFTHIPPKFFPKKVLEDESTRIVHVVRNPMDTIISYYHFITSTNVKSHYSYTGTFQGFCPWVVDNGPIGSIFEFLNDYFELSKKYPGRMKIVSFEDLKTNGTATLKDIADFIGVKTTLDKCQRVVDACNFDKLKKREADGATKIPMRFLRKGTVDQWKSDMNESQIKFFQEKLKELPEDYPYKWNSE